VASTKVVYQLTFRQFSLMSRRGLLGLLGLLGLFRV
jgi:hypothetical protein